MPITRRLTVLDFGTEETDVEKSLRLAFASTDMEHVDQHFGSAEAFVIHAVNEDGHSLIEAVQFGKLEQDGNEAKLEAKIEALDGCAAVFVQAVGASAVRKLTARNVQAVKVSHGSNVRELLDDVVEELRDGARGWLARAVEQKKDPGRFDDMEAEGWSE